MWSAVGKSGSPISRWMMLLPVASRALARASTSKADSVPSLDMRSASGSQSWPDDKTLTIPRLQDGDSPRRRLGFLFHGRLRPGGPGVSYVSSAGIARRTPGYGKTCRKDVLCRVDVPAVAGRAGPLPGGTAQFGEQVAAS